MSVKEQREEKEKEAQKEAEKKAQEELLKNLGQIKSFALGTTPNFVIDLNKDMLQLDDIDQLIVTFGQFGKMVQREILYFSDNYDVDYDVDERGKYIPLSMEVQRDDDLVFNDELQFVDTPFFEYDSEGKKWDRRHKWTHHYQTIRNPKFTYNKIYNTLTLTLSQNDTLRRYKPTDWNCPITANSPDYDIEDRTEMPYWRDNPSLVMVEVKIKVRRQLDYHFNDEVIIRPQEYWAVAETIEYKLKRPQPDKPGKSMFYDIHDRAADDIYVPHRFRLFFDDFSKPKDVEFLPQRVEELGHELRVATNILVRDGLRLRSRPQYEYVNINSEGAPEPHYAKVEKSRFFCVMIPLHIKVKLDSVRCVFGGSPGIMDRVNYDSEGLRYGYFTDSEGKQVFVPVDYNNPDPKDLPYMNDCHWYDEHDLPVTPRIIPDPHYKPSMGETCYFQSNYVIDPSGRSPENPMGEYICWYICSKDPITGQIGRMYGPTPYMADQEPYYEFLLKFKEIK